MRHGIGLLPLWIALLFWRSASALSSVSTVAGKRISGNNGIGFLRDIGFFRVLVFFFDKKPCVIAAVAHFNECKGALELFAEKYKTEFSFVQTAPHLFFGSQYISRFIARVHAPIPNDDITSAIFTFRNLTLEICIRNRVIFGHERQPFVLWI